MSFGGFMCLWGFIGTMLIGTMLLLIVGCAIVLFFEAPPHILLLTH